MNYRPADKKGSVFILALWALVLLTIFAVQIGIGVRQKIDVLSRLEKRAGLRFAATSGVQAAAAVCRKYFPEANTEFNAERKAAVMNAPVTFEKLDFPRAQVEVSRYPAGGGTKLFGVIDEESKININTANFSTLAFLAAEVLALPAAEARTLAAAIIDWRERDNTELKDFSSSGYYAGLEFPYRAKHEPYERLEELLLVKGMDPEKFERLKDFVTIYGDGAVDINTAPAAVFTALGMSKALQQKILSARKGRDGVEGTADDHIFDYSNNNGVMFAAVTELEKFEIEELNRFFVDNRLGVVPGHFFVRSTAKIGAKEDSGGRNEQIKVIESVFRIKDAKIIYWIEK